MLTIYALIISKTEADIDTISCAGEIVNENCQTDEACVLLFQKAVDMCSLCAIQHESSPYFTTMTFANLNKENSEECSLSLWSGFVDDIYEASAYKAIYRKMSNENAWQTCEREGAHLLQIETEEEWNALSAYQVNVWQFSGHIWTGAVRDLEQSQVVYHWTSGADVVSSLWKPGEPNDEEPDTCVQIRVISQDFAFLADKPCRIKNNVICEKNQEPVTI